MVVIAGRMVLMVCAMGVMLMIVVIVMAMIVMIVVMVIMAARLLGRFEILVRLKQAHAQNQRQRHLGLHRPHNACVLLHVANPQL